MLHWNLLSPSRPAARERGPAQIADIGRNEGQNTRADETDDAGYEGKWRRVQRTGTESRIDPNCRRKRLLQQKDPLVQERKLRRKHCQPVGPEEPCHVEKKDAADQADDIGMTVEPAQDCCRLAEGGSCKQERQPKSQAVDGQEESALDDSGAVARQKQNARQDRTDTGNPAGTETHSHQRAAQKSPPTFHLVKFSHAPFGIHESIEKAQNIHERGHCGILDKPPVCPNSIDDPADYAERRQPEYRQQNRTKTLDEREIGVQILSQESRC